MVKMRFIDAPLGARFKYPDHETVWVKLNAYNDGLIVKWNGNQEGFQSLCSFNDKDEGIDFNTEIELID